MPATDLEGLTDDIFDRTVTLNLRGPFAMVRAFHPLLERGSGAAIVNISDIAARTGLGSSLAYLAPFSLDNCSLNSCESSYARFDLLGQIQKRRDVRCYRLRFRHCRNEVTHSEGGENLAPVAYGNTEGVR